MASTSSFACAARRISEMMLCAASSQSIQLKPVGWKSTWCSGACSR
jgi:hypothetical protein